MKPIANQRAISPIIATLLLILIAIAAGVVVYAYVVGFVGNSTSNSGATTNTLSIDNLGVSSQVAIPMATAYVRNLGPSSEAFSSGFFIKSSSFNFQLVPAITVKVTGTATTIAGLTTASLAYASATTITVSVTIDCAVASTITLSAFGQSIAGVACPITTPTPESGVIALPTGYVVSNLYSATVSGITATIPTSPAPSTVVVGATYVSGTISVPINSVLTIPVTESGLQVTGIATGGQFNNPLSAGSTYSVQIAGTDGAQVVASAKSS